VEPQAEGQLRSVLCLAQVLVQIQGRQHRPPGTINPAQQSPKNGPEKVTSSVLERMYSVAHHYCRTRNAAGAALVAARRSKINIGEEGRQTVHSVKSGEAQ
jgi:hypothetical protein